jgi:hypothetical protein
MYDYSNPSSALLVFCLKNRIAGGHQWLTPIILATQEAEIRRIKFGSQPGQTVPKTLSQKYTTHNIKGLAEWLKV